VDIAAETATVNAAAEDNDGSDSETDDRTVGISRAVDSELPHVLAVVFSAMGRGVVLTSVVVNTCFASPSIPLQSFFEMGASAQSPGLI